MQSFNDTGHSFCSLVVLNQFVDEAAQQGDELAQRFAHELSEESKYFRFMNNIPELTETMLVRFTQIDYSREMR